MSTLRDSALETGGIAIGAGRKTIVPNKGADSARVHAAQAAVSRHRHQDRSACQNTPGAVAGATHVESRKDILHPSTTVSLKDLTQQDNQPPEKPKSTRHWILWILVALFIVLSITAMMMADFYYAPGSGGTTSEPKNAAEK